MDERVACAGKVNRITNYLAVQASGAAVHGQRAIRISAWPRSEGDLVLMVYFLSGFRVTEGEDMEELGWCRLPPLLIG